MIAMKYKISPEKELVSIYKWVSLFRFPISVGRDPRIYKIIEKNID